MYASTLYYDNAYTVKLFCEMAYGIFYKVESALYNRIIMLLGFT